MNLAHSLPKPGYESGLVAPASFPACRGEVTRSWVSRTLAPHPKFIHDPIRDVQLSHLGDGIGQLSALMLARLTCRSGARHQVVIKLQAPIAEMHQIALNYGYYETEVNFYAEMAAEIALRTPEIYVCAMDRKRDRVVVIMEGFADWHSPDQISGASADEVRDAVTGLASLASTYWDAKPSERYPWLKSADSAQFASLPDDYAACLPEFLNRFEHLLPADAAGTLCAISDNYARLQQAIIRGTQVLAHWDYRVENLFFSPEGELAVIDWQLMHMDNPANDLAYLLATNVDVALRRQIEPEMMSTYLRELNQRDITQYQLQDLHRDYRLSLLAISAIPVIGGASTDVTNDRSLDLFAAMGSRLVTAINDWQALEVLVSAD